MRTTMKVGVRTIAALLLVWLMWGCPSSSTAPTEETSAHPEDDHQDEHADSEESSGLIKLAPESQQLAKLRIEAVGNRVFRRELRFPGTIQANENRLARVGSRVQGRVVEVSATLGARVQAREQLAVIDSPDLGQAQSDFLTARTRLAVAEQTFQRANALLEGKVIGRGEFQRREGEYLTVQAEAQATEDRLRSLGLEDTEITRLASERSVGSRVAISTPISGTVIERHVTLGEVVEPAKPLFTVADLSMLWAVADLPERDLPLVKAGLVARVAVAAYPDDTFPGRLTYIADMLDPSSRAAHVRVEIDNPRGRLKPEMFATVSILSESREEGLSVPEEAVQRDEGRTVVFVAHEDGFEPRPVEVGAASEGHYPVRSGIRAGERVVTRGAFVLKSELERGQMEDGHGH